MRDDTCYHIISHSFINFVGGWHGDNGVTSKDGSGEKLVDAGYMMHEAIGGRRRWQQLVVCKPVHVES